MHTHTQHTQSVRWDLQAGTFVVKALSIAQGCIVMLPPRTRWLLLVFVFVWLVVGSEAFRTLVTSLSESADLCVYYLYCMYKDSLPALTLGSERLSLVPGWLRRVALRGVCIVHVYESSFIDCLA